MGLYRFQYIFMDSVQAQFFWFDIFPPFFKKTSFALKFISSKVSIQSDANPGHITTTFFVLFLAKFIRVSSV